MLVSVNGIIYNSLETPILLVFDNEQEKEIFGMNRFVSAPEEVTIEERQALIARRLVIHHIVSDDEIINLLSTDVIQEDMRRKRFDLSRPIEKIHDHDNRWTRYEQEVL